MQRAEQRENEIQSTVRETAEALTSAHRSLEERGDYMAEVDRRLAEVGLQGIYQIV